MATESTLTKGEALWQKWKDREIIFAARKKELAFQEMLAYLNGDLSEFDVQLAGAFWQERNYGEDEQEDDWVLVEGKSFTKKELVAKVNSHIQRLIEDGSVYFKTEEGHGLSGISNLFHFIDKITYKDSKINIDLEPLRERVAASRADYIIRAYPNFSDPMSTVKLLLKGIWDGFDGETTRLVFNRITDKDKANLNLDLDYQAMVEEWKGVMLSCDFVVK